MARFVRLLSSVIHNYLKMISLIVYIYKGKAQQFQFIQTTEAPTSF